MRLTAKPLPDGTLEFYAGGRKVDGLRCKANTARISGDRIEATAYVTCDRHVEQPAEKKRKERTADAVEHTDAPDMDA